MSENLAFLFETLSIFAAFLFYIRRCLVSPTFSIFFCFAIMTLLAYWLKTDSIDEGEVVFGFSFGFWSRFTIVDNSIINNRYDIYQSMIIA